MIRTPMDADVRDKHYASRFNYRLLLIPTKPITLETHHTVSHMSTEHSSYLDLLYKGRCD